jgi:uncharacterized protein YjiS (DUF1127 family)
MEDVMTCRAEIETGIGAPVGDTRRPLASRLARVLDFVMRAGEVARQRRALMRLDDRMLKDFGASRADAEREGARAWWDLPERR